PLGALRAARGSVTEQPPAGAQTLEGPTRHSSVSLVPQVVEVELVHQPLDRDLQLRHLVGRLDAICNGDELDAGALQPAVELERLHDVSREARQIVDEDDGEGPHARERGRYEALVGR